MKKCLLKFISFILASVLLLTGCHNNVIIEKSDTVKSDAKTNNTITYTNSGSIGFFNKIDFEEDFYKTNNVAVNFSFGKYFFIDEEGKYLYHESKKNYDYTNLKVYIKNDMGEEHLFRQSNDYYVSEEYYCYYDYIKGVPIFNHTEEITIPAEMLSSRTGYICILVYGDEHIDFKPTGETKLLNAAEIYYQTDGEKLLFSNHAIQTDTGLWIEEIDSEYYTSSSAYTYEVAFSPYPIFKKAIEKFALNEQDGRLAVVSSINNKKTVSIYDTNGEFVVSYIFDYDGELLLEWEQCESNYLILCFIDEGIVRALNGYDSNSDPKSMSITESEDNETYINEVLRSTSQTTEDGITYTLENKSILGQISGNTSYSKISAKDNEGNEWVIYDAKVSRVSEFVPGLGTALWFIIQGWELIFDCVFR